jgi:subtilisin family serine protease
MRAVAMFALLVSLVAVVPVASHQDAVSVVSPTRVRLLLELATAPLSHTYAAALHRNNGALTNAAEASRTQLTRLEGAQQALLATLSDLGVTPLYRLQRVLNAVAVEAEPSRVAQLARLPGVVRVSPLIARQRGNARGVPLIGTPAVWASGPGGTTGAGISIGIIDTGIDYTHVGLGGSGLTSEFNANNGLVITDTASINNFGPGKKVRGGYDFAGDRYAADCSSANEAAGLCSRQPRPDPDPFDSCDGHGSHVAGTAAGSGVLNSGAAYSGPYNESTNFTSFRVGPGVAPEATLYAIRVFGCGGSSDLVEQGIEWALDPNGDGDLSDQLDVINLSLGGAFGGPNDPSAVASNNAALAGMIVVAAAGNSGDSYYIIDSPGVADRAISVAASVASDDPELVDTIATFSARGPRRVDSFLKPDLTAPGNRVVSVNKGTGNGATTLSGTSMATPHVAGMLALLRELHPDWTVEELKALAMNTATQDIFTTGETGPITPGPGRIGAGRVIASEAASSSVIAYNADHPGLVSVSFGRVEALTSTVRLQKSIRIVNKGTTSQSFLPNYVPRITMDGVSVYLTTPSTIDLTPGQSTIITVHLDLDPRVMTHDGRDPAFPTTFGTTTLQWLDEVAGYVELENLTSEQKLRVPVHAVPRRLSALEAGVQQIELGIGQVVDVTIPLSGTGILTDGLRSLMSAFELHEASPRITEGFSSTADLAYVGAMSDNLAMNGVISETTVAFGLASYEEWTVPHSCDTEFRIYIDTNNSGIAENNNGAEYVLVNTSAGDVASRNCSANSGFVTGLYRVSDNALLGFDYTNLLPGSVDTAIYNTNVLVMPVSVKSLGLNGQNTRINYRVQTAIAGLGVVDSSATHTIDVARPGLHFNNALVGPMHDDPTRLRFIYNRTNYLANDSQGLLLLHHHNGFTGRAEVVPLNLVNKSLHLPIVRTP